MNNKQQELIEVAKSGNISDMYQLISDGTDSVYFDKNSKNALDYAIASDPIKAHILLNDLLKKCNSAAQKEILKYYIALAVKVGGDYEK